MISIVELTLSYTPSLAYYVKTHCSLLSIPEKYKIKRKNENGAKIPGPRLEQAILRQGFAHIQRHGIIICGQFFQLYYVIDRWHIKLSDSTDSGILGRGMHDRIYDEQCIHSPMKHEAQEKLIEPHRRSFVYCEFVISGL